MGAENPPTLTPGRTSALNHQALSLAAAWDSFELSDPPSSREEPCGLE